MNKTSLYLLVGSLILIIGIIAGVPIGSCTKTCPNVKVGKETLMVTVTVHDTVIDTINRSEIQVVKKPILVHDTVKLASGVTDIKTKPDTTTCYSFSQTESDNAFIKVDVCSDSLPVNKPMDLKGDIFYKAPPDTHRVIRIVDTVSRVVKTPFYQQPAWWVGLVLGCVGGYFAGHNIH